MVIEWVLLLEVVLFDLECVDVLFYVELFCVGMWLVCVIQWILVCNLVEEDVDIFGVLVGVVGFRIECVFYFVFGWVVEFICLVYCGDVYDFIVELQILGGDVQSDFKGGGL